MCITSNMAFTIHCLSEGIGPLSPTCWPQKTASFLTIRHLVDGLDKLDRDPESWSQSKNVGISKFAPASSTYNHDFSLCLGWKVHHFSWPSLGALSQAISWIFNHHSLCWVNSHCSIFVGLLANVVILVGHLHLDRFTGHVESYIHQ